MFLVERLTASIVLAVIKVDSNDFKTYLPNINDVGFFSIPGGWEVELAQKYYRKLFREYAVGDLSRYKVSFSFAMPRISEHDSIIVFYE